MSIGRRWWMRFALWSMPVGLVLVWSLGWGLDRWDRRLLRMERENGARIVQAVEAFAASSARVPDSLAELVPKYLNSVPEPRWGDDAWEYTVDKDGRGFFLIVGQGEDRYPSLSYSSKNRMWCVNQ